MYYDSGEKQLMNCAVQIMVFVSEVHTQMKQSNLHILWLSIS